MAKAITRKFLVKKLPDLSGSAKEVQERYYLYNNNSIVIRVQKINEEFELERKANESDLVREGEVIKITKDEFEKLKKFAIQSIQRESYEVPRLKPVISSQQDTAFADKIQENPKIVLRVYRGDYEGLVRAEVNFESEEEANNYKPLDWFEREITGTALSQDGYLLKLTKEEFKKLLI